MKKTIILPACDDGNRGDQALVWRTRELAKEAGLAGSCKMLTDNVGQSPQSEAAGIGLLQPILRHPSTRFSPGSNMRYGKMIVLVWGIISVFDSLRSILLLTRMTRPLVSRFLSNEERQTLLEIQSADACIVKGGGFIHTTGNFTDSYKAFFFLYHIILALSLGKAVYVMPNSFGPFEGAFYSWIVRRTLSRCKLLISRETVSQDMLRAIGVESLVMPDLAFGLEAEYPEVPHLQKIRMKAGQRPLVGITARPYRFPGSLNPDSAYKKYLSEMVLFSKWLFDEGYYPVFIEHVVSSGEHESDISAIAAIADLLPDDNYSIFQDSELNSRQIKSVYGECDYVIGTRFHSVIFALSEGTPAIAIGYGGNKGRGIMRDIGMPEYVVEIEDFNFVEIAERFTRMTHDAGYSERIAALLKLSQSKHSEIVKLLSSE